MFDGDDEHPRQPERRLRAASADVEVAAVNRDRTCRRGCRCVASISAGGCVSAGRLARRRQPPPHRFEQLGHAGAGDAEIRKNGRPSSAARASRARRPRRRRRPPRRSCSRRRSAASRRASAGTARAPRRMRVEILDRIASGRARHVHQVHEHLRALEVAQELMAEAVAACAPSISPGTSATTKLRSSLRRDDAEVRRQRRERVVGDLRPRRGDARDQRRLAGVREADEADVGEQLQLEAQVLDLAGFARLDLARRAIGGRGEPRVAHAAASALGDEHALAFLGEIGEQPVAARPDRRSSRRPACRSAPRARDRRRRGRCSSSPARARRARRVNSG